MKFSLAILFLSLGFNSSNAQETATPTEPPQEHLRAPFTLTLAIDSEQQYEQEIDAIPYVDKDVIYLYKGEVVGIRLLDKKEGLPSISYCQDIEKADVLFRFSQKWNKKDETLTMMLAIDSRIEKELFMDGLIVVPGKERVFETTILPLKPGTTNYESWPHPIVQMAIRDLRFEEENPRRKTSPILSDRLVTLKDTRIEELIRDYSAMSRKELPEAISRWKNGLKKGAKLFVTTRIEDPDKNTFEQVFVQVESIEGDTLSGKIDSTLTLITNYQNGDSYSCPESAILDWMIQNADGSEEGNYIGKFMGVVRSDVVPLIIETEISASGEVTSAKFDHAMNRYKEDLSFCVPDKARREAEQIILKSNYPETEKPGKHFVYLIYRFHDDVVENPKKEKESE